MAAPLRNLFSAIAGSSGATTFTPDVSALAAGALAGDLVVIPLSADGNPTISLSAGSLAAGWAIGAQQPDATNACRATHLRFPVVADGTVPNPTVNCTVSEAIALHGIRIRPSAAGRQIVVLASTHATGSSTNPNPPALANGSGAARDILYVALWGGDANVASTAVASPYANHQSATISNAANGCAIGSADRTVNAVASNASEDPPVFTRATEQWVSYTLGFYDVAPAEVQGTSSTAFGALEGVVTASVQVTAAGSSAFGAMLGTASAAQDLLLTSQGAFGALGGQATASVGVAGVSSSVFGALGTEAAGTIEVRGQATIAFGALGGTASGEVPVSGLSDGAFGPLDTVATASVDVRAQSETAFGPLATFAAASVEARAESSTAFGALGGEASAQAMVQGSSAGAFGALNGEAAGSIGIQATSETGFGALGGEITGLTVLPPAEIFGDSNVAFGAMLGNASASVPLSALTDGAFGALGTFATASVELRADSSSEFGSLGTTGRITTGSDSKLSLKIMA